MRARPGTWHDDAPEREATRWAAVEAWENATLQALIEIASTYPATITYGELYDRITDATGYRTGQQPRLLMPGILGAVQREAKAKGLPPLTSLVVRKSDGTVGPGYISHDYPDGIADARRRERVAAADRFACYQRFAPSLPRGAGPVVVVPRSDDPPRGKRAVQDAAPELCAICWLTLPASGVCGNCG